MPVELQSLLAAPQFQLHELVASRDVSVGWVSASDLDDPTPFLERGQLLLTTGRQFTDDADTAEFESYVLRLLDAGVAALGFGTEVIRSGVPDGLEHACREHLLPLFEVPYRTPFIALGRWVAEREATAARARADWALDAQKSIAVAAISHGGLAASVERASVLLGADIAVLDRAGTLLAASHRGPTPHDFADRDLLDLLSAGRRASRQIEADGETVWLQTLGRSSSLLGALALRRATRFDAAEQSAITTLLALAEVSLEHTRDVRRSVTALLGQLYRLLLDGRVDVVRRALRGLPAGLPRQRFVVATIASADLAADVDARIESLTADPARRTFRATLRDRVVLLIDEDEAAATLAMLEGASLRCGVSSAVGWPELGTAVAQSARALESATAGRMRRFDELVASSLAGLVSTAAAADIANGRLSALLATPDGRRLLTEAGTWLHHNAQWEPAAAALSMHRHTLKARMTDLGARLDLPLERFAGRAELWMLLTAAGLVDARG